MSTTEVDHAAVRFPPPLVYLAIMVSGELLHRFVLPIFFPMVTYLRVGVAIVVGVLAVALTGGAIALFRRTHQALEPWKTTPEILAVGVYSFTRNPMYLGLALLQASIGLGCDRVWIVALIPLSLTVVFYIAVRPEEVYLAGKFGETYVRYRNGVRRWI